MALGKLRPGPVPQFPYLYSGDKDFGKQAEVCEKRARLCSYKIIIGVEGAKHLLLGADQSSSFILHPCCPLPGAGQLHRTHQGQTTRFSGAPGFNPDTRHC